MKKIYIRILERLKYLFPVLFFLWMTYVIFAPSTLFLNNIDEFRMHYIYLLPTFIIVSAIFIGLLFGVGLIIPKNLLKAYYAFLFAVAFGMYLQMNFLNPPFRSLDGAAIDWDMFSFWGYLSAGIWCLILVATITGLIVYKERIAKIIKFIAVFLSAVQIVSLFTMIIMAEIGKDNYGSFAFSKEEQFSIGSDKNIVIFVIDSLQVEAMEEYFEEWPEEKEGFEDFTFFTNTVSGGAPTAEAMPVLLTGIEYDPMQLYADYCNEIWEQTTVFDELENAGYDIRLFTDNVNKGMPEGYIEGYKRTGTAVVSNHKMFITNLYSLVNFLVFPQQMKEKFYISSSEITNNIGNYSIGDDFVEKYYHLDDVEFYNELVNSELDNIYHKAFRLYHLEGAHGPYIINENMERVETETSEKEQIKGVMKIVKLYMDKLKEKELYENTTIIITGDHGRHEVGSLMVNPAIFIKRAKVNHTLEYNAAPICFRNVLATIMMEAGIDYFKYGPSVYDITENSDVERLHTVWSEIIEGTNLESDVCWEESDWYRVRVSNDGRLVDTWNPFDINKIVYQLGDIITFDKENQYSNNLNYRIYKENGMGVVSNELTICFNIPNIKAQDASLEFVLSEIYGNEQIMKIYVNGQLISELTCIENMIGQKQSVVIPQEAVEDIMVVRMVFPGAVTPHMLDKENDDTRVLSVGFLKMKMIQ